MNLPLDEALPSGEMRDTLAGLGIKDVEQLAALHVDARKKIDSSIRYPGENASVQEKTEFYKRIGAPETKDGYRLPEGSGQSQFGKTLDRIRGICHSNGMSVDAWNAMTAEAAKAESDARRAQDEGLAQVKEAWDLRAQEAFGTKAEQIRGKGQQALRSMIEGDPELGELLAQTGLDRHPTLLEVLSKVQELTSGEVTPQGMETTIMTTPKDSAMDLAAELRALAVTPEFRDKSNPQHEEKIREWFRKQKTLVELGFTEGCTDPKLMSPLIP